MAAPPIPSVTGGAAGPSSAADTGDVGGMGAQSVGDYYARGARRREGLGWEEFGTVGLVALAALGLWLWLD